MAGEPRSRYSSVAIGLHWVMAVLIVGQLVSGLWMTGALKQPSQQLLAFQTYQLHKSAGLLLLVLSVLRLLWRVANPPPPLPPGMTLPLILVARATHVAFYAMMLTTPLIGWAMVSSSPLGLPTIVFGLFEWPHIGWLARAPDKRVWEGLFKLAHHWLGYGFVGLLGLHIAAALKHHLVDRDDVLARMLPLVGSRTVATAKATPNGADGGRS